MMKHIARLLVLCLLVLVVLISGCLSPSAPEATAGVETTPMTGGPGNAVTVSVIPPDLLFVTEEYPPFNYVENGTLRGIAVDLLHAVYREMGSTLAPGQVQVLPWTDAYEAARSTRNTAVFATVRLPEREHLFRWVGPLASERKVIFGDPHRDYAISGPGDLSGYRIGVVEDDAAGPELRAAGVDAANIIEARDVPALIALMQEGEIDLWCYGDLAGRYFTRNVTGNPDTFAIVSTLETRALYYAFHPETPDSVIDAFQAALDSVRYEPDQAGVTEYQRVVYHYIGVSCMQNPPVSAEQVTGLVNYTAEALETDTPGTLARINAGEHPFWDRDNRALYVFVYNPEVTLVAEADNPRLVGMDMRWRTDVAGTAFRNQIVGEALDGGTGWVDYIWMIPEENGIYHKSAYFRLTEGSDGNQYIVASGRYLPCSNPAPS
ncbi:abc-type amino acid transport, signal transduction system, periplasmic component/domain [hydrocarbon metagenome]|uniref:Abc-type amino acid transport, signal transduction system, periplasmic component/domain n=1 Tax=hydrocarbon metagenome TaxID=938273 RepID=A0A0W8F0D8_9ZZZZ